MLYFNMSLYGCYLGQEAVIKHSGATQVHRSTNHILQTSFFFFCSENFSAHTGTAVSAMVWLMISFASMSPVHCVIYSKIV